MQLVAPVRVVAVLESKPFSDIRGQGDRATVFAHGASQGTDWVMVLAATRKSRPVTGCDQVFSASARMAHWRDPRAGGELKSEPTTENRNRAHKAPVERGCV